MTGLTGRSGTVWAFSDDSFYLLIFFFLPLSLAATPCHAGYTATKTQE
jgi:hypothetical protein